MIDEPSLLLPEFDLAQAIGMLSFALGILCFYQRDDQHLRIMMVVMNLNHALCILRYLVP